MISNFAVPLNDTGSSDCGNNSRPEEVPHSTVLPPLRDEIDCPQDKHQDQSAIVTDDVYQVNVNRFYFITIVLFITKGATAPSVISRQCVFRCSAAVLRTASGSCVQTVTALIKVDGHIMLWWVHADWNSDESCKIYWSFQEGFKSDGWIVL